jgi:hypothetical protein
LTNLTNFIGIPNSFIIGRTARAIKNRRVDSVWPEIRSGHLQSTRNRRYRCSQLGGVANMYRQQGLSNGMTTVWHCPFP